MIEAKLGPSLATWRSIDGRGDVPPPQSGHSFMRSLSGAVLYGGHSFPSTLPRFRSKYRVHDGIVFWKATYYSMDYIRF